MVEVKFYDMNLLGHVDGNDFTDYQGIGSDPLYKRYDSVLSILKNKVSPKYQSFLARPHYDEDEGYIYWYVPKWNNSIPKSFKELSISERQRYSIIKDETINYYNSILSKLNTEEYSIIKGTLKYIDDDFVYCYDNKVVLIAWGMKPDTTKHVVDGRWFKTIAKLDKKNIVFDVGKHGRIDISSNETTYLQTIIRDSGYKLIRKDIPIVLANEGYNFIKWNPEPLGFEVIDDITFVAEYSEIEKQEEISEQKELLEVFFNTKSNGEITEGEVNIKVPKGYVLKSQDIPIVSAKKGYKFDKWIPSILAPINNATTFVAEFKQEIAHCKFLPGEFGTLKGNLEVTKPLGVSLLNNEVPIVKPQRGYKFIGWDIPPLSVLTGDRVCTAQYEKKIPWYKRIWMYLTGKGCLKWLLWALIALLLLWLLSWLLRSCVGCSGGKDRFGRPILPEDSAKSIGQIKNPDGTNRDNNGSIASIVDDNGNLPDNGIVSPIVDDEGGNPPIIENPGTPDIIANRLNIYFEDENADLNQWAKDFKKNYPSSDYTIIGYDPNVKMIQIQIPEQQRDRIREELPRKITNHKFFVVDESIMQLHGHESASAMAKKGWHLKATHIKEAWNITKGSKDVVVAIVDDGIDVNHKIFKGRFYKAYNVFTQNRALSVGQGHGTHVAGLAVGSDEYYESGAAGVAPRCKIMPVQVFDNGLCTFSSLASGIMYAIHNGADVVNISVGASFAGLDQLPEEEQVKVVKQCFKNEEKVFKHIIKVANEKNVILVFAAGNDNIITAVLPECRTVTNTINVAANTSSYTASNFTNYSIGTNISAPGVNIYSSYTGNAFKMFDGTSMAAPIISGTIALMKSIKHNITVSQIIAVLQKTGKPLDNTIPPMVLIDKAVQLVKSGNIPKGGNSWKPNPIDGQMPINNTPITAFPDKKPADDRSAIKDMLNQLKSQRDALNKQIDELERKIK